MRSTYPITELYAWIADDPTGAHGIIGVWSPSGLPMQAVSSNPAMKAFGDIAQQSAKIIGRPVELRRFVLAEVLDTKQPA